jgi:regulator of replication initiation timing
MRKISLLFLIIGLGSNLSAQDSKDATISALRNEVKSLIRVNEELREEINRLKSAMVEREEATKSPSSKTGSQGEEYRIQLGVQNSAIASLASPKMMAGSMINGKMVYDIGGFQNPNDAFALSQEMRKLNLAGSFVTRYVNGVRDYNYRYDPNQPQPSYNPPVAKTRPAAAASYNSESGDLNLDTTGKKSKIMVIED